MTTALVLSGGGSLGAVQVGMLQALGERGVEPDLLVGTSAGAINAAFVGGHGMGAQALDELAGLWRSLRSRNVFALRPLHGVLAVAGVRPSLFSAEPLRRLVEANLGYRDLLGARIKLHLVTTELSSGHEVMAPTTAVGVALQSLTLLTQQQLIGEVARYAGPARLKVLPPLCPLKVSAADFSHADELIARAKKATGLWLDKGGPDLPMPERFLSMHDHHQASALLPSAPRAATAELVVTTAVDDVRAGEVPQRRAEDMH